VAQNVNESQKLYQKLENLFQGNLTIREEVLFALCGAISLEINFCCAK